ncbi:hypothetical protein INR49_032872 [Caranx melampygus]|nr:hypothetical protein INR49_032872 [Caranx melampygus]
MEKTTNYRPQHFAIAVVVEEMYLGFSGNCVGADTSAPPPPPPTPTPTPPPRLRQHYCPSTAEQAQRPGPAVGGTTGRHVVIRRKKMKK